LKWSLIPAGIELTPVFVFGQGGDTSNIPFQTMVVDVEEKYTNLYLKFLEAYRRIDSEYEYDFIWKIDDDTKINTENFKREFIEGKDYVGRFIDGTQSSKIILSLDCFNLHKTIYFNPPEFEKIPYSFVTGECVFFSKKAIQRALKSDFKCENEFGLQEDRMFGYMLKDDDIIKGDIKQIDDFAMENDLQVTTDYFTIHPINETLFPSLIGVKTKEQLQIIAGSQLLNLVRRKVYLKSLETQIKDVVTNFWNSKKTTGLG
jgi:hypothetical protein